MDVEQQQTPNKHANMSRGIKRALVIANCSMLMLGSAGGPLISRLYFYQGGHRQWLSSFLETGGWPFVFIPLITSFVYRRRRDPTAKAVFITPRLVAACAVLGLMTGADDFLYSYGLSYIPVSTSALLISTQLAFTALFAFLLVRQQFTFYSLNAVALLTLGAAVLGLHAGGDRPAGVSEADYFKGFFLSLGAAALYGLVLPLVELTYAKAKQAITYTLVLEMQLAISFFATVFCLVGMIVNNDFKVIPRESKSYGLGEVWYYIVLVWCAILWQCFFLGAVGVIFCVNTLLTGIIIAVFIPVNEVLGVLLFKEKFSSEKGFALALSLWGLASYSYGEYRQWKKTKAARDETLPGAYDR